MCAENKRNGNAMVDSAPTTSQPDHCNIFPDISFSAGTRTPEQGEKLLDILENAERGLLCGTKNLKLERTVCSKDVLELYQIISMDHSPAQLRIACPPFLLSVESEAFKMIACSQ